MRRFAVFVCLLAVTFVTLQSCDEEPGGIVVEEWGFEVNGTITDSLTSTPLADVAIVEGYFYVTDGDTFWDFPDGTLRLSDQTGQYTVFRFGALPSGYALRFTRAGYHSREYHARDSVVLERSASNGSRWYRLDVELTHE